jgi:hypothetical protein
MKSITQRFRVIYKEGKGYYRANANHWTNDIFEAIWYYHSNETDEELLEGFSGDIKLLKIIASVNIED